MKQILQNMGNGQTSLVEAPAPGVGAHDVLISSRRTLISAGTERMLVGFGKASMLEKARQQPEKVRMVLDKVRTDGLWTTLEAVRAKLGQPLALGYCNVGVVVQAGNRISALRPGDRVVSNGPHADVVRVPVNLCAKVPDCVDDDSAAFTVLGSIGLQGIRLAQPTLGEAFVVIGAGLIGLLTIQLLRAHGCRVMAIDFDSSKLALAERFGATICNPKNGEDVLLAAQAFSRGNGVDGVIITASTASNEPVSQAARMSRKRGRIVLVGVVGLELNRAEFYEKELSFQVSCSYGPGRYDPSYEEAGNDYPFGLVRWTEQRNFEAILDMMADGRIDVKPLISHRFAFERAADAYASLTADASALGIVLEYSPQDEGKFVTSVALASGPFTQSAAVVGMVGAGNYASRILIPAFKAAGARLHTIVSAGGTSSVVSGRQAGFAMASTDVDALLAERDVNIAAIVTRHNSHANLVQQALRAGKHVFVEKPLATTTDDLAMVEAAYASAHAKRSGVHLMVGFNRRFAPQIVKMKALLDGVKVPKSFLMTMNAGEIPAGHWTQDIDVGGGRIIGEACHFIDLMRFLAGSPIVSVQARRMGESPGLAVVEDKASITLGFADGSFGTIMYLANGAASFPKERVEVFAAGAVLQLDNFRRLRGFGWRGFSKMNLWRQDKGQAACAKAFIDAVVNGTPTPIAAAEIFEVARVSVEAAEMLRQQ